MTPENLAVAQRAFAEVKSARDTAVAKAAAIEARIAASPHRARRSTLDAITARRLAGNINPADVAEFAVVTADLVALQAMLDTTNAEVAQLDTKPAKDNLRLVEKAHQRDQDELAFAAVSGQVTKLETALCNAVSTLHGIGQKLGKVSLVMSWKPSQRLDRAVKNGVIP
jgi:hypothetical protein